MSAVIVGAAIMLVGVLVGYAIATAARADPH